MSPCSLDRTDFLGQQQETVMTGTGGFKDDGEISRKPQGWKGDGMASLRAEGQEAQSPPESGLWETASTLSFGRMCTFP